jgi:hypothetical protein
MRTGRTAAALFGILALGLAGCAKADKADCEKMFDRMAEIQLEGQDSLVKELTRKMLEPEKEKVVAECEGKLSKSQVQCVIDAKSQADIDKCK